MMNKQLSNGDFSNGSDPFIVEHPPDVKQEGADVVQALVKRDNAYVRVWRVLVLGIILGVGGLVSTLAYRALRRNETDDYETSYRLFVDTMGDISSFHMDNFVQVFQSLSETITTSSIARNETFPFVVVPNFEVLAHNARVLSGTELIAFTPLITDANKHKWYQFSSENQGWVKESRDYLIQNNADLEETFIDGRIVPVIYQRDAATGEIIEAPGPGPYTPTWYMSPPPFNQGLVVNYNMLAEQFLDDMLPSVALAKEGLMSSVNLVVAKLGGTAISDQAHEAFHFQYVEGLTGESLYQHPHSVYVQPVQSTLDKGTSEIVGMVLATVPWDRYLANLLPVGVNGIFAVLENSCGQSYTYVIRGNKATYLGEGDLHETKYDDTKISTPLTKFQRSTTSQIRGHCQYSFSMYSSDEFRRDAESSLPVWSAAGVALTFLMMALTFFIYDQFVSRRNATVVDAAVKSNAILSSLFPSNVRDRLFGEAEEKQNQAKRTLPKSRLKNYLSTGDYTERGVDGEQDEDGGDGAHAFKTKPIADLFPETTIMFGDIAGFTAWSSVREPSQVFVLLETIYHAFDEIARRRRVFKVETIGDCYVAVAGLPDPQKDHAVIMSRFARDCMHKVQILTRKLEVTLGPDTADLAMRIGLHSGPVTAGVLRGERSRFQLFGDTMNTASRMESTGIRDRIQVSYETVQCLNAAGKEEWTEPREDKVVAKGKGVLQTYWLKLGRSGSDTQSNLPADRSARPLLTKTGSNWSSSDALDAFDVDVRDIFDPKTTRLIDWNVDVLCRLLKQVVASRLGTSKREELSPPNEERYMLRNVQVIDEIKEIITLPEFDVKAALLQEECDDIALPTEVIEQLHDFVCNIAAIYRGNPFHNFEHASHVTMSVTKLLSRIVAPSEFDFEETEIDRHGKKKVASTLHDHTYGITSDPLTQFACVFSALIHDCDHSGVPNAQLVKEQSNIADRYDNKSPAEQNSIDLAWNLLMDDEYSDLRAVLYTSDEELSRFRQLVVNSVMATDIVDKELKTLRNMRWDRAFSEGPRADIDAVVDRNRKATIVIEHLIQASDVAHTMQHWHIYRKWNERFFFECYENYVKGRAADSNPADTWYKGELGFFDFYIIPLAKKLKDCGVFGVSSDEYLNYAQKNRQEWEERGQEVVHEMLEMAKQEFSSQQL